MISNDQNQPNIQISNQIIMSQEVRSNQAFIKFLREKENTIRSKIAEKRNECINKLEENERRLITIIPKEILDMNAGEFLEKHEGDIDQMMMGSKVLSEFGKSKIEMKSEEAVQSMEARFNSPPKKSYKKVIIKKAK